MALLDQKRGKRCYNKAKMRYTILCNYFFRVGFTSLENGSPVMGGLFFYAIFTNYNLYFCEVCK